MVQVCAEGEWKRICDSGSGWSTSDSVVTCRQLGYPSPERAESLGSHAQGWDTPHYGSLNCHGNEARLFDCPMGTLPGNCEWHGALVNCSRCTVIPSTTISPSTPPQPHPLTTDLGRETVMRAPISSTTAPPSLPSPSPSLLLPPAAQPDTKNTRKEVQTQSSLRETLTQPHTTTKAATEQTKPTEPIYSLNSATIRIIGGVTTGIVSAGLIACLLIIVCTARRRSLAAKKIKMDQNVAYQEQRQRTKQLQLKGSSPNPDPIYETIE